MGLQDDPLLTYLDQWGLRRLFSLAIRRRGAPRRLQDPIVDQLFDTLVSAWGSVWKPSRRAGSGRGSTAADLEEEEAVDVAQLSEEEAEDLCVSLQRAETDEYLETVPDDDQSHQRLPEQVDGEALDCQGQDCMVDLDAELDLEIEEQSLLEQILFLKCPHCTY